MQISEEYSIRSFANLMEKCVRYIPHEHKPFRCDIPGRWEINFTHNDTIATVRIYKNDHDYSDYYIIDLGDCFTTHKILERTRHMEGQTN